MRAVPSRNFSISASSDSAHDSTSFSRALAAAAARSAGISWTVNSPVSPLYTIAFIRNRSITPRNSASFPIGSCTGTAGTFRMSAISSTALAGSARSRSIFETKAITGTSAPRARLHIFSVCTSTPETALTRRTAPSSTLRQDRVSASKLM